MGDEVGTQNVRVNLSENYTTSTHTHKFLQSLEESQRNVAGQAKGVSSRDPLYVGTETIQTAGGTRT